MQQSASLARMAASATLHCLTGCAIGEIAGMLIGTAAGFGQVATIALSIALAFVFGYGLSTLPLLRFGLPLGRALGVVLAADTLSIATMEVVDNLVMAVIPTAMDAGLVNPIFWVSMAIALAVAFAAAYPVNRWLLARGKGHALTHAFHGGHEAHAAHGADEHLGHEHHGDEHHATHRHHATHEHHGTGTASAAPTPRPWIPDLSTGALVAAIVAFLVGGFVVSIADAIGAAGH